jgi:hypothetical protein
MPSFTSSAAIRPLRIKGAFRGVTETVSDFANVVLALEEHEDRARHRAGEDRVDTAPGKRCLQRSFHPLGAFQTVDSKPGAAWDYGMDRQYCR